MICTPLQKNPLTDPSSAASITIAYPLASIRSATRIYTPLPSSGRPLEISIYKQSPKTVKDDVLLLSLTSSGPLPDRTTPDQPQLSTRPLPDRDNCRQQRISPNYLQDPFPTALIRTSHRANGIQHRINPNYTPDPCHLR